jgi:hypothetical protein
MDFMTNKNPTVTSTRMPENELGFLEGWLAFVVVWVACVGMLLSIVCFMLGNAE